MTTQLSLDLRRSSVARKDLASGLSHICWWLVAVSLGEPTRLDNRMYNLTNSL
jgi:hypothetical protein